MTETTPMPVPADPWSERRTAIHESGHAVMSYLLERAFQRVTVLASDDSLGHVARGIPKWLDPEISVDARGRNWLEDHILIAMAGGETETAWAQRIEDKPDDWQQQVWDGAADDRSRYINLAMYATGGPSELESYLERQRQRVLSIINGRREFWPLVEGLCEELLTHDTLSWRRAKATLDAISTSQEDGTSSP